jgi:glucosamine 6-phosphate synthetase-like amidotransferase/phosphosugar isomerase protein
VDGATDRTLPGVVSQGERLILVAVEVAQLRGGVETDAGMASAIVNLVPVQILAYYLAIEQCFDPDMPRNLDKSVTVR